MTREIELPSGSLPRQRAPHLIDERLTARRHQPDAHAAVERRRREPVASERERHRGDGSTGEPEERRSDLGVPDARCLARGGRDALPVG